MVIMQDSFVHTLANYLRQTGAEVRHHYRTVNLSSTRAVINRDTASATTTIGPLTSSTPAIITTSEVRTTAISLLKPPLTHTCHRPHATML